MQIPRLSRLTLLGAALAAGLMAREILKRRNALSLEGKVALITGSSSGLGLALAREFAGHGANLVICAQEPEPLELARQQLAEMGVDVLALTCDVGDQAQVQHLVDQAIAHFGQIDILVNNAGVITVGPEHTMTIQDYETCMRSMFWGTVYTTLAVQPLMQARKSGRIVNITSIGGKVSVPHLLPYSSAKFAALGFSEGLHAELLQDGITVTTVVPGLMRTGSHINAQFKGQRATEYTLFGLLATLPITSTSADNAARQIVAATQRGDTELILTLQAQLATRFHGLLPGLTTDILTLVDRLLPQASAPNDERTGRESRTPQASKLTSLGEPAAQDYNQYARQNEK